MLAYSDRSGNSARCSMLCVCVWTAIGKRVMPSDANGAWHRRCRILVLTLTLNYLRAEVHPLYRTLDILTRMVGRKSGQISSMP